MLKVDIEGAELEVLRHYKHLAGCSAVMVEVHLSTAEREEIARILTRCGAWCSTTRRRRCLAAPAGVQRWLSPAKMAEVKPPGPSKPHLFLTVLGWKCGPFHVQSREYLALRCAELGVTLTVHADMTSGVDRARNISIELARRECPDFTHFMFIDSDIAFQADDILEMMQTGYDVVGGAYPKKGVNWASVAKAVRAGVPDNELASHANDFVGNASADQQGNGSRNPATGSRFMEVEELGTGFLMLTRDCIERYIEHWKDEIAYVTDYPPQGLVHHMVFSCERDPACELEQAKRAAAALGGEGLQRMVMPHLLDIAAERYRRRALGLEGWPTGPLPDRRLQLLPPLEDDGRQGHARAGRAAGASGALPVRRAPGASVQRGGAMSPWWWELPVITEALWGGPAGASAQGAMVIAMRKHLRAVGPSTAIPATQATGQRIELGATDKVGGRAPASTCASGRTVWCT